MDVCIAEFSGTLEERFLYFRQEHLYGRRETGLRDERFAFLSRPVAAGKRHASFLHILGSNLHADGNAAHLPIIELESRTDIVAIVHFEANARILEFLED